MALSVDDRLGSCEILGLRGAEGMGEVYRVTHTRLGREVASRPCPHTWRRATTHWPSLLE